MQGTSSIFETDSHWLGVDWGTQRIGLALAPAGLPLAVALGWLPAQPTVSLPSRLLKLLHGRRLCGLVVGLPLGLDGRAGPAAQQARQLAAELAQELECRVYFADERLSSAEAQRRLQLLRATKAAGRTDTAAAVILLQGFLDRLAAGADLPPE
jgi:putative holliday junction resolvase